MAIPRQASAILSSAVAAARKQRAASSVFKAYSQPNPHAPFAHRAIIVARGHVEAPLIPKVFGTGIIIIGTGVDPGDPSNIRTNCWNYFRLKSRALHRVSRAFRKTLGKVIERRLVAFVECAQTIAELVRKDPQKVYDTMKKLEVEESQLDDFKSRYLNPESKREL